MNGGVQQHIVLPRPWGPGEGSKGQILLNFKYKVNFKECVFSQIKDIKHIERDFILSPESCHRGEAWGCLGSKIILTVCLSVILSPLKPLDEIPPNLVSELLTQWGVQQHIPPPSGEGSKIIKFNYKVNIKDFIPNSVCVLTNKRYKTYRTGFSFWRLGHALEVGLGGAWGYLGSTI